MTIEDDGNSLDGTPPEQFAPALQAAGADVIGLNCSIGPAHMLETLERMAASTTGCGCRRSPTPAGRATSKAATIYLTSPEYMASYARRFVERARAAGRRLLRHDARAHRADQSGAAQGAASRHPPAVESTREAWRSLEPASAPVMHRSIQRRSRSSVAPGPPAMRSSSSSWCRREATMSEVAIEQARSCARQRRRRRVTCPTAQTGPRLSALSLAVLIRSGPASKPCCSTRRATKPLLVMQSDLLGAHAHGRAQSAAGHRRRAVPSAIIRTRPRSSTSTRSVWSMPCRG